MNAAQRVSGVTDLKNSATSLKSAMDQLKQAIADHDTIVAGGITLTQVLISKVLILMHIMLRRIS